MSETTLLFELILLLALTATGLALFERLGLPAIAGFLVVGAFAGPGGLGLVPDPDRVRVLAEIGVIFLLFEIGLELPMSRLRDLVRMGLVAGAPLVAVRVAVRFVCSCGGGNAQDLAAALSDEPSGGHAQAALDA